MQWFLSPLKINSATVSTVSTSISHEVMGPDAVIWVLWMLSFKPIFLLSSLIFIKRLFRSSFLHKGNVMGQTVRRLSVMQKTRVWSLGWEDPLEKEMAAHYSIVAWKIPWITEPGRLPSMGSQRVGHNWANSLSLSFSVIFISEVFYISTRNLDSSLCLFQPSVSHEGLCI